MTSKKIRVFLVHAVQDKPTVRDLYARLKSEAWIDPWFDEENLLPGQDWDLEIQKTLRSIDAVIICLSKVSVAKSGYVQKEIKRALDILEEKPEGTIYIIPLRLDDCEIPSRLQKFHWVDYFNNKNYDQKLLGALKARAESLGIETGNPEIPNLVNSENLIPTVHPIYKFADMDFVKVSAGDFFMGADDIPEASPQHLVYQLSYDYYIGKFAVTNQEYSRFLREQGKPVILRSDKLRHPVVSVSWYDAQEYISWLDKKYQNELPEGFILRLPSESEWEKAARGVEANNYPWGNYFGENRCNSAESGINDTTPVGNYSPQGDSALGCVDMAGNIWEWTRSLWGNDHNKPTFNYPYQIKDGREDENAPAIVARVVRGGSYNDKSVKLFCAVRDGVVPDNAWNNQGFRVVICPIPLIK